MINCNDCKHDGTDVCNECSEWTIPDASCSCHINPPCGYCEGLKFEEKDEH